MDPVRALVELGGIAPIAQLRAATTRVRLARAIESGDIVRLPRNQLALPGVDQARRAAAATGGVLSHLSAAQHWQWRVKTPPTRPCITVPRGRRLDRDGGHLLSHVEVHWADLRPDEIVEGVTSPVRTVVDCSRSEPFDAALAVADSALRGGVDRDQLIEAAARSPRTGRSTAVRVAAEASPLADNPFESALRAIALDVPGLWVRPQGWIARVGRVDLIDETLLLAIEAESWTYHASEEAFRADVRRYTEFSRRGWVVARFLWEQVMHQPEEVRAILADLVAVRRRHLGITDDDGSRRRTRP